MCIRDRECTCTPSAIEQDRRRISGPLLDRIDLHVEAMPVEYEALAAEACLLYTSRCV